MDCYIGIDVSKATLDVASLPDGERWTVTNDDHGLAELTQRLVALEASIVADFAQRVRPEPRPLPDAAAMLLESLLTCRRQIVEMLTAEKNRLGFARGPIKRDIRQHIRWLEKRGSAVDGELQDAVTASPHYQAKADLLTSVPDVGQVTTLTLLATLPELGQLSRHQIAALVGVLQWYRDTRAHRRLWQRQHAPWS